ncbi:MAG: hypothetical protein IT519_15485 [Burkholderiales bacterium]|nr:hypothetical protein [Burkholderiales bacterium]
MIDREWVGQVLDALARCATQNQANRLYIQIEVHASPEETAAIVDGVRARRMTLDPLHQRWHAVMEHALRGDGRTVQPYARRPLCPGASMYAAPAGEDAIARRTLVIAFTGNAERLMMPLAMFLQHCPADAYDFLVLFDPTRRFYLGGVEGFGSDLPASIAGIRERVGPERYRRAVAFGTSGGGLAAVWTAVELGLPRAVSVGGAMQSTIAASERGQALDLSGFGDALARHAHHLPEVFYLAGDGAERDLRKGRELQAVLPTTLLLVPGCTHHNTLFQVRELGGLDRLLEVLLGEGRVGALGSTVRVG